MVWAAALDEVTNFNVTSDSFRLTIFLFCLYPWQKFVQV